MKNTYKANCESCRRVFYGVVAFVPTDGNVNCPSCGKATYTEVCDYDSVVGFDAVAIGGIVYVSHDVLCRGDYVGAGSVGLANINVLKESHDDWQDVPLEIIRDSESCDTIAGMIEYSYDAKRYFGDRESFAQWRDGPPELLIATAYPGFEQAWIRQDIDESENYISALCDYPCLNDESVSLVEMQWETEAWELYLRDDLLRTFSDEYQEYIESSDCDDDALYESYRDAMETTNTYPTPEYDGVHVDVDSIAEQWRVNVQKRLGRADHAVIRMVDKSAISASTVCGSASWPIENHAYGFRFAMDYAIAWSEQNAITWESI